MSATVHARRQIARTIDRHGTSDPLLSALGESLSHVHDAKSRKTVERTLVGLAGRWVRHEAALHKMYGKEKNAENKSAISLIKLLHREEFDLFVRWVGECARTGKLDADTVSEYVKRLKEGWAFQIDKDIMTGIIQREQQRERGIANPKTLRLQANLDLLPPSFDSAAKAALKEFERAHGITYHIVTDHASMEFIQAYNILRANFPLDEMDPSVHLMQMLEDNMTKYPHLSDASLYKKVAKDLDQHIHLRYYLIVAKDVEGKIVGTSDGNFIATKSASAMYWAHITVPGQERRKGIATLLYAATLELGNRYAHEAEYTLQSSYNTNIPGNKLMYHIVESEPANLESEEKVRLTFGRLLFHGKASGLSLIPDLAYAQVDLDYDKRGKFKIEDWNSVPLLLLVRRLGSENEDVLTVHEIRQIAEVLPLYFLASGLYNSDGIKYDLGYAIRSLEGRADSETASILPLPTDVDALERFISTVGTMDMRCASIYPGRVWSKEYLERFRAAQKANVALTLNEAIARMRELESKRIDTTPVSA